MNERGKMKKKKKRIGNGWYILWHNIGKLSVRIKVAYDEDTIRHLILKLQHFVAYCDVYYNKWST